MKRSEPLSNLEWVKRATSTDPARPVLTGVYATETQLLATDGHRLHVAPNATSFLAAAATPDLRALPPGLWAIAKNGDRTAIDGDFPDVTAVKTSFSPIFHLELLGFDSVFHLIALAAASEAANKSLGKGIQKSLVGFPPYRTAEEIAESGAPAGLVFSNPTYLRETLEGFATWIGFGPVRIAQRQLGPWLFVQETTLRAAAIMPIRVAMEDAQVGPSPFRFDATSLVGQINPVQIPDLNNLAAKPKKTRRSSAGKPRAKQAVAA